jgi:hypothetical protein
MVFTLVLICFTWFVWRFKPVDLSRTNWLIGWGIKVLFGVLFMLIHTQLYGVGEITVDWEEYMDDSIILNHVANQSFGDYWRFLVGLNSEMDVQHYLSQTHHWSAGDLDLMNDSRNVLRLNSLIVFLSQGNVYVHVLFFSFFSFLGLKEIFHAFKNRVFYDKRLFWFALFLFPSLGFWTSSVLKEPLMITGFALILNALLGELTFKSRLWRFVLGFVLMILFKPYVLGCLLVAFPVYFLGKFVFKKHIFLAPVFMLSFVVLLFGVSSDLRSNVTHRMTRMQFDFMNVGRGGIHAYADSCYYYFRTDQFPDLKFLDKGQLQVLKPVQAKKVTFGMNYPFEDVLLKPTDGPWRIDFIGAQCGSYIDLTPINSQFGQLIKNIPEALFNASCRPIPGDPGGKLKWVNSLETFGLLMLLLFGIWHNRKHRNPEERNVIVFLFVFSVILLVLIGWTTPVLGAIVRYRLPAYLAIFLISVMGSRPFKFRT